MNKPKKWVCPTCGHKVPGLGGQIIKHRNECLPTGGQVLSIADYLERKELRDG